MKKLCELCGQEFETVQYGSHRKYCFECSPVGTDRGSVITNVRRRAKEIAVQRLGGQCKKCGEIRTHVLDFHHRNPEEKEDALSNFSKFNNIKGYFEEIEKCDLLCANCHRDFHYYFIQFNLSYEDWLKL